MHKIKIVFIALATLTGCFWSSAAPYPAPGDTILFNRDVRVPTQLHRAIWDEVATCLGVDARPIESVSWSVADSIITYDGYLAYGISYMPFGTAHRDIIIERPFWRDPWVISHEAIHVIGNIRSERGPEWECERHALGPRPLRRPGIGAVAVVPGAR